MSKHIKLAKGEKKTPKPQPTGSDIGSKDITISTTEPFKPEEEFKTKFAEMQSFVGLIPTEPQLKPPEPSKRDHPTKYSSYPTQVIETLLLLLAEGYSLNRICMRPEMPSAPFVSRWSVENSAFGERYARARMLGLQRRAENLRDEIALHPDPIKAKLLFEHDKWFLSKMLPKTYGDRIQNDVNVTHEVKHVIDASQLSPDELEKLEDVLRSVQALPAPEDEQ